VRASVCVEGSLCFFAGKGLCVKAFV
jgi:hypothetical protein